MTRFELPRFEERQPINQNSRKEMPTGEDASGRHFLFQSPTIRAGHGMDGKGRFAIKLASKPVFSRVWR